MAGGKTSNHHDTIARHEHKRKKHLEDIEEKKREISRKNATGLKEFGKGRSEVLEQAFKTQTVGLVSREEFLEKRQRVEQKEAERKEEEIRLKRETELARQGEKAKQKVVKKKNALSFAMEEEEGEEEEEEDDRSRGSSYPKLATMGKDPSVETDFLPDKDREKEEEMLRAELEKEWLLKQEAIKAEPLTITYSYWNGAGHRRQLTVKKGDTISTFLRAAAQQLATQFREMKAVSSSGLMYIKEDVILPHTMTFYELITKKAQGKSGPLFQFDLKEHAVASFDPRMKSQDSHAGKVVEKHWFSNNKHIFPYSKWEMFDLQKHIPQ